MLKNAVDMADGQWQMAKNAPVLPSAISRFAIRPAFSAAWQ
jgi:hypothetical protein